VSFGSEFWSVLFFFFPFANLYTSTSSVLKFWLSVAFACQIEFLSIIVAPFALIFLNFVVLVSCGLNSFFFLAGWA
jgi:hypothetical protein